MTSFSYLSSSIPCWEETLLLIGKLWRQRLNVSLERRKEASYFTPNGHIFAALDSLMLAGNYFVYITTNPGRTVLYTGVSNDLRTRMQQHYENRGRPKTFAGRYFCYKLVYYERFSDVAQAIAWEKEVKNMSRAKKEALIHEANPRWDFLLP